MHTHQHQHNGGCHPHSHTPCGCQQQHAAHLSCATASQVQAMSSAAGEGRSVDSGSDADASCCGEAADEEGEGPSSTSSCSSSEHSLVQDFVTRDPHLPSSLETPSIQSPTSESTAFDTLEGHASLSWRITGMDCPSCARSIENALNGMTGVRHAKVVFATQKLQVEAQAGLAKQIQDRVSKIGFCLVPATASKQKVANNRGFSSEKLREYGPILVLALLVMVSYGLEQISPTVGRMAFIASTLVGLLPIMNKSWQMIRAGSPFAIETLMSVAALGALFIGAMAEAAMVLLLFMLGALLESYASNRARQGVSALMALLPDVAVLVSGNGRRQIAVADLQVGDIIEVAPGVRLPADGELLTSAASFDESALTGESVPVERFCSEIVPAGSLCVDTQAQLKVVSQVGHNAIDRILHLIEEAEERRAPIERFLDRFSRIYTPSIMCLAVLVSLLPPVFFAQPWDTWIYRGLALLLIGCPCALVISTPAAITSGLAAATRRGALIKGGLALEQLGRVQIMAFDKTGTLTQGKPSVTEVFSLNVDASLMLASAAAVEAGSHHPLARAIVDYAEQQAIPPLQASHVKVLIGHGIQGHIGEKKVQLLAPSKLAPELFDKTLQARITTLEQQGNSVVLVLEDEQVLGLIALRDSLREDAKEALAELRGLGIKALMLTGDNPRAAAVIAQQLNIEYRASLLPQDKVQAIAELSQQQVSAMVGDGINDAPAMKAASIGIAMGSGTDVALETAEAALTHNRLRGLADMIRLSRATNANIRQNIAIALGLKGVFLVTTLLGLSGLWLAVLADTGATVLVTLNALRLLRKS